MKKAFILSVLFIFLSSGYIMANSGQSASQDDVKTITLHKDKVEKSGNNGPFDLFKKTTKKITSKVKEVKNKLKEKIDSKIKNSLYSKMMLGIILMLIGIVLIILGSISHIIYLAGAVVFIIGVVLLILSPHYIFFRLQKLKKRRKSN